MKLTASLLVLFLLCTSTSVRLFAAPAAGEASLALNVNLSSLRLFDLSGRRHDIKEVKTQRVVLVLWAFWCDTWKKSLPALSELSAEEESLNCKLWTVSVDGRWTEQIRPLVESHRVPFPVLLDDGGLSRRLGLRRVPTVLVLDRQRRVVWSHEGYPGNERLERAIRHAD